MVILITSFSAHREIAIGGLICDMDLFRVTIPPSPLELAHMGLGTAGPVGPGFAHDPVAASARLASVTMGGTGHYNPHDQHQHRRDSEASSSPLSPVRQVGAYPPGSGGSGGGGIGEETWHGDGGSPVSPVSAGGGSYGTCHSSLVFEVILDTVLNEY